MAARSIFRSISSRATSFFAGEAKAMPLVHFARRPRRSPSLNARSGRSPVELSFCLESISFFASRIRRNQRLLSSASPSTLQEPSSSSSSSPSPDSVHMTENCVRIMKELQASDASSGVKMLRLCVETGGCSGFQYLFDLDDKPTPKDRVFETGGVKLIVDNISYDFVNGATIDYVEELIRSAFVEFPHANVVPGKRKSPGLIPERSLLPVLRTIIVNIK